MGFLTDIIAPGPPRLSASALLAVREFQLEDVLNRRPADLPYATRRLVAIARSVAAQPAVLLLDEPAAGLDERSSRELADLIRRLAKEWGMAVLLVEHDVAMVLDLCDHVEVLNFGKTLASGPPSKIRTDPAVVEAYIGTTVDDPAELATAGPVVGSARVGSGATRGAERRVEL
jgi:sulfate-transporting ATPase